MGRKIGIGVAVLLVAAGIAAAVVLGKLGRIIERAVETVGPQLTGTPVALGGASVSVFSGEGALRSLAVANPEGFTTPNAFDLGKVSVAVDVASVASDVVHVRSVVVDGPQLVAEFDAQGRNNLKTILDHVQKVAGATSGSKAEQEAGAGKKMIIDEFRFENAQVRALSVGAVKFDKSLKIPDVVLKDLGKKQGGAAAADIADQIFRPVVNAAIKAARNEYLDAQKGKLEDKAKEKGQELMDQLFD